MIVNSSLIFMEKNLNNWMCIDFGTCNTAAAIAIDNKPHIVTNCGQRFFPTVACVMPDGLIQVCQEAEALRMQMPESFKQEFKLQIHEPLNLNGVQYIDIVAEILRYVKGCAQIENNNTSIESVVLTIPALYTENDKRIDIMYQAAIAAGFINIEFLSEPQAAALHYSSIIGKKNTALSLIYDLGGGTFDPVLLDMSNASQPKMPGNEFGIKCGGQFFDKAIYNHINKLSSEQNNALLKEKKMEDYAACKRLKEALSIKEKSTQFFSNGQWISLDRSTLNELIKYKISYTIEACDTMLHVANKNWSDLKQILLVGGSTSIPLIQEMLKKHLISHNTSEVRIIRNMIGPNGEYNHLHATCLGGISKKIIPQPLPAEPIAKLMVDGRELQLKPGLNSFGRSQENDFKFDDMTISRNHFTITVSKDSHGSWSYNLTTCSAKSPTIVNDRQILDIENNPITTRSTFLQDRWTIRAGKKKFTLVKIYASDK